MEEPPFPDYPCDGCGKSFVDMEQEEEAQQKALKKEQTRIESGAVYRRLEQEHAHQNNNNHTAASYFTRDSNDSFHPKNLADALRMGSRNVATTNFAVASRRTCATGTGGIGADDDMGTASVDLF
jgi:4-diphosphocytidyl-2C-methyl-D-erythritol kinase